MQRISEFALGAWRLTYRTMACLGALAMVIGIAMALEDMDYWLRLLWGGR